MKKILLLTFLLLVIVSFLLYGENDISERIDDVWQNNSTHIDDKFFTHEKSIEDKYNALKRKIIGSWDRLDRSTQFNFVEYSDDAKKKHLIAFKEGFIEIELIEEKNIAENIEGELSAALLNELKVVLKEKDGNNINYLKGQVEMSAIKSAKNNIKKKSYKAKDGKIRNKYTMVVPLKKNHLQERAKQYAPLVLKYANKYNVKPDIIMAIMECESEFNPYADNGMAYGLMQIVPKSGGYDASKTVFGKKRLIKPYKLKKPELNIHLGVAHLYQSYTYKAYFKNYGDMPDKQDLMVIASYNCGAPRVSGWIKKNNSYLKLNSAKFFNKLYNFLPKETKGYIKKVPPKRKQYLTIGSN